MPSGLGNLAGEVPHPVHPAATAQALGPHLIDGLNESAGTVGGDEQRCGQATTIEVAKELEPGLTALLVAQGQRDQNLPAVQSDAPGAQDGFAGDAVGAQRFVEPVQKQAQERKVTEVTVLESLVLFPENLGHLADLAATEQAATLLVGESVLDVPSGQAAGIHLGGQTLNHL